ncbi:MAG: hypothetical protein AABZ12_10390 [Planctomycetota bacterium]
MSDSNSSDSPQKDPAASLPRLATEQELDEALAKAAELASELSGEVGSVGKTDAPVPSTTGGAAGGASFDDGSSGVEASLDSELAKLEGLAREAATDLGSPEPKPAVAPANVSRRAPTPDFMAEFTAPEPEPSKTAAPDSGTAADRAATGALDAAASGKTPASGSLEAAMSKPTAERASSPPQKVDSVAVPAVAKAEAPAKAAVASAKGVAETTKAGVVGNIPKTTVVHPAAGKTPAEVGKPVPAPRRVSGRGVIRRVEPMAMSMASLVVRALEFFDEPFSFLGAGIRNLLGWLAIATLIVSVLVVIWAHV